MKRQIRVVCIVVLSHLILANAFAFDWSIDHIANNGDSPNLYLDTDSRVHICYREYNNRDDINIKYGTTDVTGWDIQTIYSSSRRLEYMDAAWDIDGQAHIAFRESYPYGLYHLTSSDNGQWQTELIDSEGVSGTHASITIDNYNQPRIAHYNYNLKYAAYNGTSWGLETLDIGNNVGVHSAIQVDSNNRTHISYYDAGNDTLKYALYNDSEWTIQIIDEHDGRTPSMVLDSFGNPHITYWDASSSQHSLKYTMWDGDSWNTEVIAVGTERFQSPEIILTQDNEPIIAFHDGENEELKLACLFGDSWTIDKIDDVGYYYGGVASSMILDDNNILHIAYNSAVEKDLFYATATIPEPATLALLALGGLVIRKRK